MRGRGPFRFTGLELLVTAVGLAVASVVIFLFGVVVGRDVAFEHSPVDARVARLPVEAAAPTTVAARPKAAFVGPSVGPSVAAKRVTKVARELSSEAVSKTAQSAATHRPVSARDDRRVRVETVRASKASAAETVVAKTEHRAYGGAVAPDSRSSRHASSVDMPSPATARRREQHEVVARRAARGTFLLTEESRVAAGHRASSSSSVRGRRTASASVPGQHRTRRSPVRNAGPAYTVQVLSTRDVGAAESLARSLKARGLGAYVRPAQDSTGRWFRVRIGRFDELGPARALATRCRKDLSLDQAYVISD